MVSSDPLIIPMFPAPLEAKIQRPWEDKDNWQHLHGGRRSPARSRGRAGGKCMRGSYSLGVGKVSNSWRYTGVAKTVGPRFREFSRQCGRKWPKQKQEQELNSQKWGPTRRQLPYQIPTVIIKWNSSKLFYGTTIWSVHTFILVSKFLWFQNSLCYDNNLSARRPSCFSKLSCEVCASPMHHKLHC